MTELKVLNQKLKCHDLGNFEVTHTNVDTIFSLVNVTKNKVLCMGPITYMQHVVTGLIIGKQEL